MNLRRNANYYQGNSRDSASLPDKIIEFSFIIPWAGRHLRLKLFHRKNFDADINHITDEEGHVFHEQIKRNKGVLSELNFHRHGGSASTVANFLVPTSSLKSSAALILIRF